MKESNSQTSEQETPLLLPTRTPMYPFQNNCQHFVEGCGEYILPEDAGAVFAETIGVPANKSRLKAFLAKECNIPDPTSYSFPDILAGLRLYIERDLSNETFADPTATRESAAEDSTKDKKQSVPTKEPSREAQRAYKLYYGGFKQEEVAGIMTKRLRRSISQGQVSRWIRQYKEWRRAEGIPVDDKKPCIISNSNMLDIGARTDGKLTGDPRHKKDTDFDT